MKRLFPAVFFILFFLVSAQAQSAQPGQKAPNGQTQSGDSPSQAETPAATASQPDQQPAATSAESPGISQAPAPHTEFNSSTDPGPLDPALDPGPLPNNKLTLIGGTARKVDQVRNRVLIQPFGGGQQIHVMFDERTHIYRDGRLTTLLGIHRGDRIYVDTMALGPQVFARSIRVETGSGPAEAHGQVLQFDPEHHIVHMRDTLTSEAVSFTVSDRTVLRKKDGVATVGDLMPGTLLEAVVPPGGKGGSALRVDILAVPGTNYAFVGRVTDINLSRGMLALDNTSDGKNYELRFDAPLVADRTHLVIGATISATTHFDGKGYYANSITIVERVPDSAAR